MGWIADLLKEIPSAARYKSELEAMEKENAALKSKVSILEAEDVNLRQEIQRRDDVIQKEKFHTNLQEIEEKILVSLANKERITESQIAQSISVQME